MDFFHDNLEEHGDWREVGDYGYCWQPRDVGRDWRPYRDGRWLYTDAGWTWDSDEPYSWAVYHYGRWARVDRIGWVWVPGTEWGPAWVSWRRSERHVGWAPLPPEATFTRTIGFNVRVDADYDIGPTNYSFVNVRDFGSRRLSRVIIAPQQNVTIINRTTNITNITYVNNTVINNGPQYEVISRESAVPIRKLKLDRREDFDGDPRTVKADQLRAIVKGDSVRIAAPSIDATPAKAPRKVVAKVEKAEVNRGWKDAGTADEVAKLRAKIKDEPARPKQETGAAPEKEKADPAPVLEPKAPAVAKESPAKDDKPTDDGKMPKGKAGKKGEPKGEPKNEPKSEPKAESKADARPNPKPAVVAKPMTPEEARRSEPPAENEKKPAAVPSKKGKISDAPERTDAAPVTKREKETSPLREPKRVEKKPVVRNPEVEKAERKNPVIRKDAPPNPQPAEPASEPTKRKGKKKGQTDEEKAE